MIINICFSDYNIFSLVIKYFVCDIHNEFYICITKYNIIYEVFSLMGWFDVAIYIDHREIFIIVNIKSYIYFTTTVSH